MNDTEAAAEALKRHSDALNPERYRKALDNDFMNEVTTGGFRWNGPDPTANLKNLKQD